MLADWSIPGEHPARRRSMCRGRFVDALNERSFGYRRVASTVQPSILTYINRLSDLLWLFGRKLEHDAGVSGSLRDVTGKTGNRFSRAW